MSSSAVVGNLLCQKNSFLKTFQTAVLSCNEFRPITDTAKRDKKNAQKSGVGSNEAVKYGLELADTIFFPEGGGQPSDEGTITLPDKTRILVEMILRDKLSAVHVTQEAVEPGTPVTLEIDWKRRWDHMQQHTGQHLLSAVLDTYNLDTLSWSMGEVVNYVEIPVRIGEELVERINSQVNDHINQALPITVVTSEDHGDQIDMSKVPEDYDKTKGTIRVIKIGNIDKNVCCGTHLSSTSQIQAVALLHQSNIRGGHSRLHFICGSRVYQYLRMQNAILKNVSGNQLSCQVDEVAEKVDQMIKSYKKATARESSLLKEIAAVEATRIFDEFSKTSRKTAFAYRSENSSEYIQAVQKELLTLLNKQQAYGIDLNKTHTVVFITGDYASGTGGIVKTIGPSSDYIQKILKEKISSLKGGGKGNSYQGKVLKYEKSEVENVLNSLKELH